MGFDFEVAIDRRLSHPEHDLNCGLDVDIFLYSHDRDEIVVVLDWIALALCTAMMAVRAAARDQNV